MVSKKIAPKDKTAPILPTAVIKEVAEEFVKDLGVTAEVSVTEETTEEGPSYLVALQGEDLAVLIGFHGETLNSLQLLLSLIVSKKLDQWTRLTLDAGDWRAKRFETLSDMAISAADKVVSTGEEMSLPIMSSSDRRLIHLALQDNANVITQSLGEEGYRRVVIKKRP